MWLPCGYRVVTLPCYTVCLFGTKRLRPSGSRKLTPGLWPGVRADRQGICQSERGICDSLKYGEDWQVTSFFRFLCRQGWGFDSIAAYSRATSISLIGIHVAKVGGVLSFTFQLEVWKLPVLSVLCKGVLFQFHHRIRKYWSLIG
eukprot:sb/3473947/